MVRKNIIILLILLAVIVGACGIQQTSPHDIGSASASPISIPFLQAETDENALANAAAAATQASFVAVQAEGTRMALSAQGTRSAFNATAVSAQSTGVAVAHSTGTAVAMGATRQSLSVKATEIALSIMQVQAVVDQQASQTRTSISLNATATAVSNMANLEAAMIRQEATRISFDMAVAVREQDRADNIIIAFGFLVFLFAFAILIAFIKKQFPSVVKQQDGSTVILIPTPDGYRPLPMQGNKMIPAPAQRMLPANTMPFSNANNRIVTSFAQTSPQSIVDVRATDTKEGQSEHPFGKVAEWSNFTNYNNFPNIILGMCATGPMTVSTEEKAHFLISGQTGTGKTRRMVWPMTAALLASGAHVILVNEKAGDFSPFYGHNNVTLIRGEDNEMAGKVYSLITALISECDRRSMIAHQHKASMWSRIPAGTDKHGSIVVLIDEFLDFTAPDTNLSPTEIKQFMGGMARLARKGRALGIKLILVAQSPGERSLTKIGMNIKDQCGRITFFLEDAGVSQTVLGSPMATGLPKGYVLTSFSRRSGMGVTFCPSDTEVEDFLKANPVPDHPLPDNLFDYSDEEHTPTIEEQDAIIARLAGEGVSGRNIEQQVFGYSGGIAYHRVKSVVDMLKAA